MPMCFTNLYSNRIATKFAGQYIQSFLNVMKTQFGLEMVLFGGYLDNKDTVNIFKYVVNVLLFLVVITLVLGNKPLLLCFQMAF
jgi:hypothetical protein